MGRGSSKAGGGGGGSFKPLQDDFPEAFADGVDFQASGDVDHSYRTVTGSLQRQWDQFTNPYQSGMTAADDRALMKDWDPYNDQLYGYVRTTNSFAINKQLYDPANAGKTDDQIFTRKDRQGVKRDLQTVQTLDKAINSHTTQADASYTRFTSPNSIQHTFGLSDAQMNILKNAHNLDSNQMAQLNKALQGKTSFSNAYTSTSANRSMNAFGNPNAKQSKGFVFERKVNVPKGTKAYAVKKNAQESETIFGRKMQTKISHISVSGDGHIVIHEVFDGYK